jgi:hypothetical protein
MSSNIPEARVALLLIAERLEQGTINDKFAASEIQQIVRVYLHRSPRPKAPPRARARYMTDTLKKEIKRYAKEHPIMRAATVAKVFGTDPDRTREIVQAAR